MSVCLVFGHQCEQRRQSVDFCKTFSNTEFHRMDQEWCLLSCGYATSATSNLTLHSTRPSVNHHDHEKYDQVQYDQGQKLYVLHNLTHCPYQNWCEVCVASKSKSDHYHRETPQPMGGDVARIQLDFMFVRAEGTFVDEPRAKATVLMVICKDDGNLSATEIPFGEVVVAKIADADKMRAGKLDSAWVKAVWVCRVDKSNGHLLMTTTGCVRSRVVRRIPDGNQAGYHAEVQGLPLDTLNGSAEMLRNATVRPGEPKRPSRGRPRKDGSPAQARTTTTTGRQEATRDDPMPGSSG